MIHRILLGLVGLLALASTPAVALNVVATSPSMGALVKAVAGSRAKLTVLAGQNRDLHALQAKPTMMHALRGADLVVAIGAELEVGWLPVAVRGAANPKILPGTNGYFEAAAQVPLLDAGGAADRALGDVHPVGNPHVNMDPVRMATIARALAERLALLDSAGASQYRRGAEAFAAGVDRRVRSWRGRLSGAPGVVLYHRDAIYLLDRFGVPLLGTIEPIPGVPPTGRQISTLTSELKGRRGIIIYSPYQSPKAPESLAGNLGWRVVQLPMEPPKGADGDGYLDHIGRWVDTIASGR
jgi:zinc/manganese transport system substrate-binding protein